MLAAGPDPERGSGCGFAMYCLWRDLPGERVWLDRCSSTHDINIRRGWAGRPWKGSSTGCMRIRKPGYLPERQEDNRAAIALYESFGFALNGELDIHGELVMVKRFTMGTK